MDLGIRVVLWSLASKHTKNQCSGAIKSTYVEASKHTKNDVLKHSGEYHWRGLMITAWCLLHSINVCALKVSGIFNSRIQQFTDWLKMLHYQKTNEMLEWFPFNFFRMALGSPLSAFIAIEKPKFKNSTLKLLLRSEKKINSSIESKSTLPEFEMAKMFLKLISSILAVLMGL